MALATFRLVAVQLTLLVEETALVDKSGCNRNTNLSYFSSSCDRTAEMIRNHAYVYLYKIGLTEKQPALQIIIPFLRLNK